MIHNKFRYLLTLVALFAMTAGAWAAITTEDIGKVICTDGSLYATKILAQNDGKTAAAMIGYVDTENNKALAIALTDGNNNMNWTQACEYCTGLNTSLPVPNGTWVLPTEEQWNSVLTLEEVVPGYEAYKSESLNTKLNAAKGNALNNDGMPYWSATEYSGGNYVKCFSFNYGMASVGMGNKTATDGTGTRAFLEIELSAIEVTWNAATKTGTFTQPGYDVVLTPIYSAATIYGSDGETEKQAYETLEEAIANVQNGETIKLDWDVTSDGDIETPLAEDNNPVHFTLDLNGHSININQYFLVKNYVATFTDSSEGQTGKVTCEGFQGAGAACAYYFDSGTYFFHGPAAYYNDFFANPEYRYYLTEGKEFVDVEKVYGGYYLRVDWKTFELTIGKDRFATFYANHNVALDAETPEDVELYTITLIEEDSETGEPAVAHLDQLTGVVEKETPMLVYNGTDAQQTVKIKVTPDEANAQNQGITPLENFMGTAVDLVFTEEDMAAADYYALSGGKIFVPVYDAGTIGAHQCWLQFNLAAGAPARGITLVFEKEEATEVTEVSEVNEAGDGAWYDLSGRKLDGEPTTKGVYIKDGKKVVVK